MSRFDFDTNELDKLAHDFGTASETKQKEARSVTQRVAVDFLSRAKAMAPRGRPWLATQGIHRKTWSSSDGVHVDVFTGEDERGVNVGFYAEYGTSDTAPHPFMAPNRPAAERDLETGLTAILDPFEKHSTSGSD